MNGWSIFYQILGLSPAHPPSHYRLLGIKPEECTPEKIDQALQLRKLQLRQAIPGAHFVPLLAKFEKDHLETAAEVLKNPAKRAAYDRYLQSEPIQPAPGQIRALRMEAIQKGYQKVLAALNADGTLAPEKHPDLTAQLSQLGFSEGDIRVLLEGLSKKKPSARQPVSTAAPAGTPASTETATDEQSTDESISDSIDDEPDTEDHEPRLLPWIKLTIVNLCRSLSRVGVPVAFILLFILFLNRVTRDIERQEQTEKVSSPTTTATTPDQTALPPAVQSDEAEPSSADTSVVDNVEPAPEPVYTIPPVLDELRQTYSISSYPDHVLADLALSAIVMYEQIATFIYDAPPFSQDSISLIDTSARAARMEKMLANVPLETHLVGEGVATIPKEVDYVKCLREKLEQADRTTRLRSIQELELINNSRAASLLTDALLNNQRLGPASINRILRALERMDDSGIPSALLNVLNNARQEIIHPLTRTLTRIHGLDRFPPDNFNGLLTYRYTQLELLECIEWWNRYAVDKAINSPKQTSNAPLNSRQNNTIRSLTLLSRYTLESARLLQSYIWNENPEESPGSFSDDVAADRDPPYRKLILALWGINQELLRLARTHPQSADYSAEIDLLEIRLRNRRLTADAVNQELKTEYDGLSDFLIILIQQENPDGSAAPELAALGELTPPAKPAVTLTDIRASAYHTLLLWDFLNRIIEPG